MPTVSVTDASGTYNGSAFAATATVTGVSGTAGSSLEGFTPTLDYEQLNSDGTVTDLGSGAPVNAGNYEVTASFTGSTDYTSASSSTVDFTISKADANIAVTPYSVTYDGNNHTATGTATGVVGESLSGLDLSGTTHTTANTYSDSWTFTDTTGNYNNASGTVSDSIAKATPTVSVSDNGGTYNGSAFTATATVTGVSGTAGSSLEGFTPTLDYEQLNSDGTVTDLGAALRSTPATTRSSPRSPAAPTTPAPAAPWTSASAKPMRRSMSVATASPTTATATRPRARSQAWWVRV